ncbi:helix-turn-helix domain-containing protein [Defluviimonas salinarum]|uniref:Helix-turn-helix domain-containing protein n=1 Tax=Defluviimonas salinarum TaxID=2992147 RepID=A0ABT3J1J3_9RHOB|nr:helix-turn-helix transcriptional regulator [Defluviimonas salinarum]MCW3781556.1 helix-turn-helix domain-containing protein [Defluviimonas salinarum]
MNPNCLQEKMLDVIPGLRESLDANAAKRNLALALRTVRKRVGLTQKDIAGKMSVSQAAISKLEAPTGSMPMTDTIQRYAAACGVVAVIGFHLPSGTESFEEDEIAAAMI